MQIRFRHLVEDRDRHGNIRLYVRLPGRKKVRIRAPFGTDEFMAAYNAAVSEHVTAPAQARETKPGSFRHLCVLYFSSPTFKRLDKEYYKGLVETVLDRLGIEWRPTKQVKLFDF